MSLKLKFLKEENIWEVRKDLNIIAKIFLDYFRQIEDVAIFPKALKEDREQIIRLACNHAISFVASRYHVNVYSDIVSPIKIMNSREATHDYSEAIMDFKMIRSDVLDAPVDELIRILKAFRIEVMDAPVKTVDEAVQYVLKESGLGDSTSIKFSLTGGTFPKFIMTIQTEKTVEFWHDMSRPKTGFDLDIVPKEHPVMQKEAKQRTVINGATDANIGGFAIESIYPPKSSQTVDSKHTLNSWNHVNHPFKVTGNEFSVQFIPSRLMSDKGIEEFTNILKAAIRTDGSFITVSGGFSPPYRSPHNQLIQIGKSSPRGQEPRGSEAHCVWTYRTLEQEGALQNAYIPGWFMKENWLGIYENAVVEHGIY